MKYTLDTSLIEIPGIGTKTATILAKKNILTVKDLLLFIPLRYEDRSTQATIDQLRLSNNPKQLVTLQAQVVSTSNYYKGRRSIQSALVQDETGRLKLMWFNNKFIMDKLKKGESYLISGKLNDRGVMVQPVVEDVKENTIHTNRLVPIYSSIPLIKQGTLRRLLKFVCDNLLEFPDPLVNQPAFNIKIKLSSALTQFHFPDQAESIINSRERLALDELLSLMLYSQQIKEQWKNNFSAHQILIKKPPLPTSIPFQLTAAQLKADQEILSDIDQKTPMNRLLIGDVGSGKTVVAGIAAWHTLQNQQSACLVAPTQILAEQHYETIQKLFPDLTIELITAKTKKINEQELGIKKKFYIGTHALINKFSFIKPALIIFDEQHRFGVGQRTISFENDASTKQLQPHVLTMTATPIPRSLMLTIFSHLSVSVIDQMPAGRLATKTWLVPAHKKNDSFQWIESELKKKNQNQHNLAIFVCPFIDPSNSQALENVAAVKEKFEEVRKRFSDLTVAVLHGKMTNQEKSTITQQLFNHEIDILVTTPIVEVGLDLPTANIIVIEGAERFGLASLHQLRGRVGRASQQGYCLLFTTDNKPDERLKEFCQLHDGLKIAELDLNRRGAGNIFGVEQHGFEELKFGSWTNLQLISQARQIFEQLQKQPGTWQPFFTVSANPEIKKLAAN